MATTAVVLRGINESTQDDKNKPHFLRTFQCCTRRMLQLLHGSALIESTSFTCGPG